MAASTFTPFDSSHRREFCTVIFHNEDEGTMLLLLSVYSPPVSLGEKL